jgi:hypothetical protein
MSSSWGSACGASLSTATGPGPPLASSSVRGGGLKEGASTSAGPGVAGGTRIGPSAAAGVDLMELARAEAPARLVSARAADEAAALESNGSPWAPVPTGRAGPAGEAGEGASAASARAAAAAPGERGWMALLSAPVDGVTLPRGIGGVTDGPAGGAGRGPAAEAAAAAAAAAAGRRAAPAFGACGWGRSWNCTCGHASGWRGATGSWRTAAGWSSVGTSRRTWP